MEAEGAVSLASVYNKLNGLEPSTSAALVSFAAARASEVIEALPGGAKREVLPGHEVRVLDGNCLDGRQHGRTAAGQGAGGVRPAARAHRGDGAVRVRARAGASAAGAGRADRGAYSLIREHGLLRSKPLQAMREQPGDGPCRLSEQWVQLKPREDEREGVKLRRIKVTRHGETELVLLSNVPDLTGLDMLTDQHPSQPPAGRRKH